MKEEKSNPSRSRRVEGIIKLLFDMLLGAAVMLLVAFLLWLWQPELFALNVFWGEESTHFGQYNNVLKTAAAVFLLMTLLALYHADFLSMFPSSYYYLGYTEGVEAEKAQNKADRGRIMRTYVSMIGGSVIPLLLAFIFFPWLSQRGLLPNSWSVAAEPISIASEERILITAGNPIVSTIEKNLFELEMKKDTEYLVILRPPDQGANLYSLSFPLTGFSQSGLKVLDWAADGKTLDWQFVTNSRNITVDFEVFYDGSGMPGEYKIYAFEDLNNSPDRVSVVPQELRNTRYPFQAAAGKAYVVAAWPFDPFYSTSIIVYNADGRVQTATFGPDMELVLFQPEDTGEYEIRIDNPDDYEHEGYEMVVLTLD